jgi:hypothetical protein
VFVGGNRGPTSWCAGPRHDDFIRPEMGERGHMSMGAVDPGIVRSPSRIGTGLDARVERLGEAIGQLIAGFRRGVHRGLAPRALTARARPTTMDAPSTPEYVVLAPGVRARSPVTSDPELHPPVE